MSHKENLKFDWKPTGRNGVGILSARMNGSGPVFTKKFDATDPVERENFIAVLLRKRKGIDRGKAEEALEEIAAECLGGDPIEQEKLSQAQYVAKQADGAELFHCGESAYATIEVADGEGSTHHETYSIASKKFASWLGARFHKAFGRPATGGAVQDALNALTGRAVHFGQEKKIAVRLAEHGGAVYLDLCDDAWRVVRITAKGWAIIADPPVKFLRKKGMLPLPTPTRGGSLDLLRPLLNAADDNHWALMISWLLGAFHPRGPYPALCVNGEQGSAKSTTSKMLRMLVDPNQAMLRSTPRDERDLMIMATNGWVCAFDNLSGMRQWVSDSLCRLATGGGFGTRALYSDDTEMLFDAKRPVIFNGIEEDATKQDLLDRSIQLTLPSIREEERRTEDEIWADFDLVAPEALGALLDAVAYALANVASVKLDKLPRMADFAKWVVAAEPKLGWEPGTFMRAYAGNREDANTAALEQSSIGPAIVSLMDHCNEGSWTGTASELLEALELNHADERTKRREDWPKSGPKLAAKLRRVAPVLRRNGIDVGAGERTKTRRLITLTAMFKTSANTVTSVTSSPEWPFFEK